MKFENREHESKITCPYCGHVDNDSWEFGPEDDKEEKENRCGKCGEIFIVISHIEVTYSAFPRCNKCIPERDYDDLSEMNLEKCGLCGKMLCDTCYITLEDKTIICHECLKDSLELTFTDNEIRVIFHTIGLDNSNKAYHNYFVATSGHSDYETLEALVSKGIMIKRKDNLDEWGDGYIYHCTGKAFGIIGIKEE